MDPDLLLSTLGLAIALLAINAFFVAAEFALLTARRSQVDGGGRRTSGGSRILPRTEELSLLAQLGSSASTLALGYVVARAGFTWFDGSIPAVVGAVAAALLLTTILHVVFSEQIPKLAGVHHAGAITHPMVMQPLRVLAVPFRPLTWVLARIISGAARLLRLPSSALTPLARTPDEIRQLVTHSHEQGVVEEDEREMIHGVLEFTQTVAREVMTPRIDISAISIDTRIDDVIRLVVEEGHSRYPVYDGSIDTVVGVLLSKDLLPMLSDPESARDRFDLRALMREPYFVPDTKPVDDILAEFRRQSVHVAIVLDEFGGTYGLLTMEDLLEEIVGEINDEYDVAEPDFTPTPEGDVLIDGGTLISEVNERFSLGLPEEDFDTIGGFVFGALGRVPVVGDVVQAVGAPDEAVLQVEETEDRRVLWVRLIRGVAEAEPMVESSVAER